MSRLRFTIVKEKRPGRCDVCHKSDQFDPQTGICNRCRNLPVEELANPKFDSIQSIPPSSLASTIATIVACFCLSASLSILNGFFGPAASLLGGRHVFFYGMLLLSVITLIVSIAINRWCSDQYNERLDYRVAAMGTFSSGVGLIASLIGIVFSFSHLIVIH